MVDIVVKRANAVPYKMEDITEPLLCDSEEAAIALGTATLDEDGTGIQTVQYTVDFRTDVRAGKLIRVYDHLLGKVLVGKVVSVATSSERDGENGALVPTSVLTIKVPTEFYTLVETP